MMLSIFLDALLRSLFNVALIGIVESNSLLLVALVYLGIAGAQASGGNFRLTLLTGRVGGQCLNPLDESRIAGGSSGGSAASVAAGFCDASLGTDTGGSVRIPAAFCGLLGLRPTFGGISNHGVLPLSHSHDTVGILAQEVVDVARLYTAIAGPCAQDPTSNGQPASNVVARLHPGVEGLRLGIPTQIGRASVRNRTA